MKKSDVSIEFNIETFFKIQKKKIAYFRGNPYGAHIEEKNVHFLLYANSVYKGLFSDEELIENYLKRVKEFVISIEGEKNSFIEELFLDLDKFTIKEVKAVRRYLEEIIKNLDTLEKEFFFIFWEAVGYLIIRKDLYIRGVESAVEENLNEVERVFELIIKEKKKKYKRLKEEILRKKATRAKEFVKRLLLEKVKIINYLSNAKEIIIRGEKDSFYHIEKGTVRNGALLFINKDYLLSFIKEEDGKIVIEKELLKDLFAYFLYAKLFDLEIFIEYENLYEARENALYCLLENLCDVLELPMRKKVYGKVYKKIKEMYKIDKYLQNKKVNEEGAYYDVSVVIPVKTDEYYKLIRVDKEGNVYRKIAGLRSIDNLVYFEIPLKRKVILVDFKGESNYIEKKDFERILSLFQNYLKRDVEICEVKKLKNFIALPCQAYSKEFGGKLFFGYSHLRGVKKIKISNAPFFVIEKGDKEVREVVARSLISLNEYFVSYQRVYKEFNKNLKRKSVYVKVGNDEIKTDISILSLELAFRVLMLKERVRKEERC